MDIFEEARLDQIFYEAFKEAYQEHRFAEAEKQLREYGKLNSNLMEGFGDVIRKAAPHVKSAGRFIGRTALDIGAGAALSSAVDHFTQPKPPKADGELRNESELEEDDDSDSGSDLNFNSASDPKPAGVSDVKSDIPSSGKSTTVTKSSKGPTFNTGPQAQGGNNPAPVAAPGSQTINWSKKESGNQLPPGFSDLGNRGSSGNPEDKDLEKRYHESIFSFNLGLIRESIDDPSQSEISVLHSIIEVLGHLGNTYFSQSDKRDPIEVSLLSKLSPRESEILKLVVGGASNKVIANDVGVSENTVRNHVANIFQKLRVQNRTQAANLITKQANKPSDKVFAHVLRTVIDRLQMFHHKELDNAVDLIMQNKLLQAKAQVTQVLDRAEKAFLVKEKEVHKPLDPLAHRLQKQQEYRQNAKAKRQQDSLIRGILTGKTSVASAKKTVAAPWRRDADKNIGKSGDGGAIDPDLAKKFAEKKKLI